MSRSHSSRDSYRAQFAAADLSWSRLCSQLLQLLLKASQDKRFVCEEAEKAMRAMAASMAPLPLLKKLKAYVHHANLRVRAKAAVAISHCAARMVRRATPSCSLQLLSIYMARLHRLTTPSVGVCRTSRR